MTIHFRSAEDVGQTSDTDRRELPLPSRRSISSYSPISRHPGSSTQACRLHYAQRFSLPTLLHLAR